MANAERIAEQIRGGASFIAYARQFSQASSAAVGGDLGWMRAEQLPESIAATIRSMNPGSLGGPVEVSGGIMHVALTDQRQIGREPREAVLNDRKGAVSGKGGVGRVVPGGWRVIL